MMIKPHSLLIIVILLINLTRCANTFQPTIENNEQNQTLENMTYQPYITNKAEENISTALSDEDFIVNNKDAFIELRGSYRNLIIDEKIVYARYSDDIHLYDDYVYENFNISVSLTDTILSIDLKTSEFETSRGIRVGDSISDVFEKYGEPNSKSREYYSYYYEYKDLIFHFDANDIITKIELYMI